MKMKSELPFVTLLAVILPHLGVTHSAWLNTAATASPETAEWTKGAVEWTTGAAEWTASPAVWTTGAAEWTTELPVQNLGGKMFTLSGGGEGRISLHRPFHSTRPLWTTSQHHRGVSVCLRYITDYLQTRSSSIFTLSPSSTPLKLGVARGAKYWLSCDREMFKSLYFQPSVRIAAYMEPDIWTRVCITVDSRRNVAQVFSGSDMSVRKFLPSRYVWSGEGEIEFSGFDGQVTDVQVWDYPLHYAQVYSYMTGGTYTPYRGSVLSWSHVTYSLRGKVVLEDAYRWQQQHVVSQRGRGRRLKKKTFLNKGIKNVID